MSEDMPSIVAPSVQTVHDSDDQKQKDNPPRRHSASPQRRAMRKTDTHENSAEHSPLHHHHQTRAANKAGGFSPSSERKASPEGGHGIAPNTPGRSRLGTTARRPDASPEEASAVPKFEWDESDPSAGDGFTGIFDKVSKEKQSSTSKVPMIINDSVYLSRYHHDGGNNKYSKFCCCGWGRKSG